MRHSVWRSVVNLVPHGHGPSGSDLQRRHRRLLVLPAVHVPGLAAFGPDAGPEPGTPR